MKYKYLLLLRGGLASVLVVFLVLVFYRPFTHGWALRRALLEAAADAATIRVVEHTDRFDGKLDEEYKEKIYRSVILSANQMSRLRKAFPISFDYSYSIGVKFIFSPNHRIEFVRSDGKVSVLDICFKSNEIRIDDGAKRIMPVGWASSLRSFIITLGMSPAPIEAINVVEPTSAPTGARGSP